MFCKLVHLPSMQLSVGFRLIPKGALFNCQHARLKPLNFASIHHKASELNNIFFDRECLKVDIFNCNKLSKVKLNDWAHDYYLSNKNQHKNAHCLLYDLVCTLELEQIETALQMLYRTYADIVQLLMYMIDDLNKLNREHKENGVHTNIGTRGCGHKDISGHIDRMLTSIRGYLSIVLADNMLELKQIEYDTSPGQVLELIGSTDGVHKVRSLSQLKRRLTDGRMCWALFSRLQSLVLPLVYIHVALSDTLITSMKSVFEVQVIEYPECAIFYSVNSPHSSLTGLDLAPTLISRVAKELASRHPSLHTFSTLSPVPQFVPWFQKVHSEVSVSSDNQEHIAAIKHGVLTHALLQLTESDLNQLHHLLCDAHSMPSSPQLNSDSNIIPLGWMVEDVYSMIIKLFYMDNKCKLLENTVLWDLLEPIIRYMVGYYLLKVQRRGEPYDPVARFHLRNGAILRKINFGANTTTNGLETSMSCMVNYSYSTSHYDALEHERRKYIFGENPNEFPMGSDISELSIGE